MEGRHGAGKVVMRTAPTGTGIIAGGRCVLYLKCWVFRMLLINRVAESYNMIRATLDGLKKEASPRWWLSGVVRKLQTFFVVMKLLLQKLLKHRGRVRWLKQ